jgi:nucleoid-associated protein YgaU
MGRSRGRHAGAPRIPGCRVAVLALLAALAVIVSVFAVRPPVKTVTRTVTHSVRVPVTVRVPGPERTVRAPRPAPGRYTVRPGDTLWEIAAAQYWPAIERANAAMLRRQHDIIYAGDVLVIPVAG